MTKEKMNRELTIERLFEEFRCSGYEGVSLSSLSVVTGLGKSSLYHYFPSGKEQMVTEVLEYGHQLLTQNILIPLQAKISPRQKIEKMCETLLDFYNYGKTPCLLGTLIVGARFDSYQDKVGNSLKCWIEAVADVLKEAGVEDSYAKSKAENAIISIQGGLLIARGTGEPELFVRQIESLPDTLLPLKN
jgi:TetR/AcrR family transcriptional regulator, lmrAB and yxaGH operons repressor